MEEDADNDNQKDEKSDLSKRRESFAMRGKSNCNVDSHEESTNLKKKSCDDTNCTDALSVEVIQRYGTNPISKRKISLCILNICRPNEDFNPGNVGEQYNAEQKPNNTNQVKTYNRVMSNHRSVTKPKDVKYKRINKAKSKSLEELRGRLKNWVEQGSKLPGIALEHSQSYA